LVDRWEEKNLFGLYFLDPPPIVNRRVVSVQRTQTGTFREKKNEALFLAGPWGRRGSSSDFEGVPPRKFVSRALSGV